MNADHRADDAMQEDVDRESEAFRKWYERENRTDVIDFNSAYKAWHARADRSEQ